jgi:hypothetical protein
MVFIEERLAFASRFSVLLWLLLQILSYPTVSTKTFDQLCRRYDRPCLIECNEEVHIIVEFHAAFLGSAHHF